MMENTFNFQSKESELYQRWEDSGYFNPDALPWAKKKTAKPFTIIMPPPNANGSLHIGHAVFVTLQDILIRFWRMRGKRALWLPGADHAGFETQVVFDKKLEKEGKNRFSMERETLWRELLSFTQENKKIMEAQLKRLGASCDWSREMFTLDPNIIAGVYETFKKMHGDGLVYRDMRVVNWCPKHQTALSDLEVKYVEREDLLYYINYGPLTLATVRPETKFGDTALAVNPNDARYKKYIGKTIEAQGILGLLKFKVIGDDAIDPNFGTGVVKVTPAHDPADFEIWQRHKDKVPGPKIIIDDRGRLTGDVGEFMGLTVKDARAKVAEKMAALGILEKTDPHYKHQVATCYKCGNTLEPLPKPQWFVRMKPLVEQAITAVKQKKITFYPDRSKKVYFHWLNNIRDWNISRQIVWGIRIPAWYCGEPHNTPPPIMSFHKDVVPQIFKGKTKTYRLRDHHFRVGEKVLFENSQTKTLFGYGVITATEVTTVGQIDYRDPTHYKTYKSVRELVAAFKRRNPEKTVTAKSAAYLYAYTFHPFTEKDARNGCGQIIVSRQSPNACPACGGINLQQDPDVFDTWFSSGQWPFLTLGYPHGKDFKKFYPTDVMETGYDILFFWVARMIMLGLYRTGKPPFKAVYLHGLVRDKDKQKMSKSKGNVIDPLGVAQVYGADAVRMALVVGNTAGNDIIISEDKIRGYRNFSTKIWNASKFVLANYDVAFEKIAAHLSPNDRKRLAEFKKIKKAVVRHLERFKFHLAAEKLYHYFWHTFADKVIEENKMRLRGGTMRDRAAAYHLLHTLLIEQLKLLHPFMPFITEEVYSLLPIKNKKMLMIEEIKLSR